MTEVAEDSITDQLSDVFAAWIDHIEDMPTEDKAKQDAFLQAVVRHTFVMEADLAWARSILQTALENDTLHTGTQIQARGFVQSYSRKYESGQDYSGDYALQDVEEEA
jgi:uncharacterized protein YktB (UPF0637 family)